ncbi:hypothetical protein MUP77_14115 [Candidatus Bathyarchaeota archaeon]|nr:hypothetical protein [Candidatus Bathyarchaeota archaeon]
MEITDILQVLASPQAWPLFLTFLGGYVMMNVFFERTKVKNFTELERVLIAFGMGLLFEYFLFYPLVTLASFWRPFSDNNLAFSAILFCAVSGSALFVTIHNEPKLKIVGVTKRILNFSIIALSAVVILVCSIALGVMTWYQPYTLRLISDSWNTFTGSAIFSLISFAIGAFFIWSYILKTSVNETIDIKIRGALKKHYILPIIPLIALPLIAGVIIVPIDTNAILFTPRMQTGARMLSSIMQTHEGFEKVVFINATRVWGNNISAAYHYYALMNTTYNITLPTWQLLSSVYIDNPSNASFTMGQYYPSLPSATDALKLYVAAPDNVTYNPILKQTPTYETKVTGLIFNLGNFTGNTSLTATLTYWQEIDPIDKVKIDYGNLTFADLGNGTWTETHTIMITNNSNDTLFIPAMDYDRFNFDYVIKNTITVYWNGNLVPWAEPVWQTRLSLHIWAQPQTISNVTISFQTKSNPANV